MSNLPENYRPQDKAETKVETKYFLVTVDGANVCTEMEAVEADTEDSFGVSVLKLENGYQIEALAWYTDGGICYLTVNHFSLLVSLRIFSEMVRSFDKNADSEGGPFGPGPAIKEETSWSGLRPRREAQLKEETEAKEEMAYRKSHERQNF